MIQIIRLYKIKDAPKPPQPTIPHLKLRQQWLDDMKKDPSIVWQVRDTQICDIWCGLGGREPEWCSDREYRRKPKTYKMYMCLVRHMHTAGIMPFALAFKTESELDLHCKQFALMKVGDVVERGIEERNE